VNAPGTFLLTFDVELLWGVFFDAAWRRRAGARWGPIRDVFREILSLLDEYEVPATFAFVGHLFLDRCSRDEAGAVHADLPAPKHRFFRGGWYDFDPATNLAVDPLWYGRDLVTAVREAKTGHEIGCHGFSHAFLDRDRDLARAEMRKAAEVARAAGVTPRSFVYPRNLVGFTEELAPAGFTHYRETVRVASRAAKFLLRAMGEDPPVGRPIEVDGVVRVPGGIPILNAFGARRLVSHRTRIAEVRRGLVRAAEDEACFHLWTHPHNFVEGRKRMMRYLDGALAAIARSRAEGAVRVLTMAEVAP
jgi:peptidoglycan/xylan/chitin deacetylase (PgdA/CDA1 family)